MRILDLCLALVSFLTFCLQQPIGHARLSALMCANANPSHRSLSFSSSVLTTWIPRTVYRYF